MDFIKKYNVAVGIAVFAIMPLAIYFISDLTNRSFLKEAISIITIMAFSFIFAQFFISRVNKDITYNVKFSKVVKLHKILGYLVVAILFLHPFLIVLPRFFEAGVSPLDAFIKIITNIQSMGIIFGITAWLAMVVLGFTSYFRDKLKMKYKNWRVFHGLTSFVFILFGTLHVINLGRHSNLYMSLLFLFLMCVSAVKLFENYLKSKRIKSGAN
jgi:predicted ferric reductase